MLLASYQKCFCIAFAGAANSISCVFAAQSRSPARELYGSYFGKFLWFSYEGNLEFGLPTYPFK